MSHTLEGKIVDGKYRIEDVWREEPSGFLCAAVHTLMNTGVVLKVLPAGSASGTSDFDAEVKMLSSVSHPALLSVRDCSTASDGTRYCVFEPFSGESLAVRLSDGETFSATQSLEMIARLAEALVEVGEHGYLHGAIEPENIILGRGVNGELKIKLIGFGNEVNSGDRVSFSAPESISGLHSVSPASDVYSLAAILYRLLVGRYPYEGSTVDEIAISHAKTEKLPMSGITKSLATELAPILSQALSMSPEMRPTTREFLGAVTSSIETASRTGGSYFKTAAVVIVGIAVLSAAMIYLTYMRAGEPETAPIVDNQGLPVQPLSPATGALEANLIGQMPPPVDPNASPDANDIPGGDGFNPWAGAPPAGAPSAIPPGGDRIVVEPGKSQFMPPPDEEPYYVTPQAPKQGKPSPTPPSKGN